MASDLFGGTQLNIKGEHKTIDKIIGKPNVPKKQDNYDFLNDTSHDKPTQK